MPKVNQARQQRRRRAFNLAVDQEVANGLTLGTARELMKAERAVYGQNCHDYLLREHNAPQTKPTRNWQRRADALIGEYIDADSSREEIVALLTDNGVPDDEAEKIAADMRPMDGRERLKPGSIRFKLHSRAKAREHEAQRDLRDCQCGGQINYSSGECDGCDDPSPVL